MDWNDSPAQAEFRAGVRQLIAEKLPARYRGDDGAEGEGDGVEWMVERRSQDPVAQQASAEWATAISERGWIAPHWPVEYGGAGLSPIEQMIYNQEMAMAAAPRRVGGQGVSQFGPALVVHGTEEQKKEHIPKILAGERIWAQGFSEPGAGSDLASLQTRATRDGDFYVVNGQKIWTSGGHLADWLYVLCRTDPEAPKHRGISLIMMDKSTPGITVRPLVNMAWVHHFNETFFEDVRVPVANRVGEENRGWYVSMTLLDYERSNITGAVSARRQIRRLMDDVNGDGKERARVKDDPSIRSAITDRYIESEVQFNFSFRIISMQERGLIPNYEASVNKLFGSELSQKMANTGVKALGLWGGVWDEEKAPVRGSFPKAYCLSVSSTIAAGTSEIQRGIIATRGLGLPRG